MARGERKVKAGEYRFAGESTPLDVLNRLIAGDVYNRGITFPEGLTIFEMADTFAKSGQGSAKDFIDAATDPARVSGYDSRARSLEGFLFPDTYPMPRTSTAGDVIRAMLTRFDQVFTSDMRA